MMKSILLVFQDDDRAGAAFSAAASFGRRFGSHITGLYVHEPPQVVAAGEMAIPPGYIEWQENEDQQQAEGARTRFRATAERHGVPVVGAAGEEARPSASWQEMEGLEREAVASHGRLFDMIAMGRSLIPSPDKWLTTCEAALFESGRPVLLAPAAPTDEVGRCVVIAWNGSTETARAIALSMPLLEATESVAVLSVEGGMVAGPSGDEVASHLIGNGIRATARHIDVAKGRTVGEAILAEATSVGADLLIKGAYTHSRFRQMIFGGATQHILSAAQIPVLLAH